MTAFTGHTGRECGEHRSTGDRAWCHGCGEWCYPVIPCKGCELPQLRASLAKLTHPAQWPDIGHLDRAELETEVVVLRYTLNALRDAPPGVLTELAALRAVADAAREFVPPGEYPALDAALDGL